MENPQTTKIALVDDDHIYHELLKYSLKSKKSGNIEIMSFFNGFEALDYINAHPEQLPETLLLDINMPYCNGWMFIEEFNKMTLLTRESIKVFMVSSSISDSDLERAQKEDTISSYFTKPISTNDLSLIVDSLT